MEKAVSGAIKQISCGCRDWSVRPEDNQGEPTDTFTVHSCAKLQVLQQHKSLKRWYYQKKNQEN